MSSTKLISTSERIQIISTDKSVEFLLFSLVLISYIKQQRSSYLKNNINIKSFQLINFLCSEITSAHMINKRITGLLLTMPSYKDSTFRKCNDYHIPPFIIYYIKYLIDIN